MFRNKLKWGLATFAEFFSQNSPDKPSVSDNTDENDTGFDRLKKMFQVDEFGNITSEAYTILQVSAMSVFVGAIYGGIQNSKIAYADFMKYNEATSFKNHLDAKRQLQDKVTVAFGKGAFRWGSRVTIFSTTFVGTATMIQVYRGKDGISEYIAAGGISGFLYKFNMGPRGWIVGSGLGMALGLVCGLCTKGLLALLGISMADARQYQSMLPKYRHYVYFKGHEEYKEKEEFPILQEHQEKVKNEENSIKDLDKAKDDVKK